jgi:hypothetical protein
VTPQNWWFLGSYSKLRAQILTTTSVDLVAALGEEAWQSFGDRGPVAALIGITRVVTDVKLLNYRNFVVPETSGKAEELVDQGR